MFGLSGVRNCSFAFLWLASMKCLGLYYGSLDCGMGFEGVPGFLFSVLLISVFSGLSIDLARRRFYGIAWNH